ncbi:hypothetical protein [Streptomyces sp. T12]
MPEHARQAGAVRSEVSVSEVIALALGLAWAAERSAESSGLIACLITTAM